MANRPSLAHLLTPASPRQMDRQQARTERCEPAEVPILRGIYVCKDSFFLPLLQGMPSSGAVVERVCEEESCLAPLLKTGRGHSPQHVRHTSRHGAVAKPAAEALHDGNTGAPPAALEHTLL